ncbi:hypothetical protein HaMNV_gp130 [Helicoverpa armigera multiple nucleopolyhedrovirus]|uniref:Orf130 n=2 Tax=Alphabaculovirus TaxID=558016 RepID=I3XME6_NPVMB|nr:hypothetical protein McnBVgp136 [Mamestra configurata nucleopolyhedrovirus B]YP_009011193.1 hypothetical protein [Mamestra brassicae multiple nucleopolyhedrovirus]ACH88652.1 hypothetical protein HaMNV_gp130 [Helicoverpa armigera multiple nucleopolyhedrovirus]WNA17510.1 hypothetical protein [Alphabaculovirus mabrassicae]AAM95123.1 hypothetical protein [Mamestra configurata nucleopolyhedrovirus B]AFL64979.1 hypothetical protein [Mamestra brassicae multiple nucleopolyhedrovirus]AFP95848.1 Mab
MELIKPFIKYSQLYRHTKDDNARRLIYKNWCSEIGETRVQSTLMVSRNNAKCDYCYNVNDQQQQFCTQCFFPLSGNDTEFMTYCLLSVCYFETNCESLCHRTVYRQRLKMIWYEYERSDKVYEIVHSKCYQCQRINENVNAKYTYFNDEMFCITCMFPLFVIQIQSL